MRPKKSGRHLENKRSVLPRSTRCTCCRRIDTFLLSSRLRQTAKQRDRSFSPLDLALNPISFCVWPWSDNKDHRGERDQPASRAAQRPSSSPVYVPSVCFPSSPVPAIGIFLLRRSPCARLSGTRDIRYCCRRCNRGEGIPILRRATRGLSSPLPRLTHVSLQRLDEIARKLRSLSRLPRRSPVTSSSPLLFFLPAVSSSFLDVSRARSGFPSRRTRVGRS